MINEAGLPFTPGSGGIRQTNNALHATNTHSSIAATTAHNNKSNRLSAKVRFPDVPISSVSHSSTREYHNCFHGNGDDDTLNILDTTIGMCYFAISIVCFSGLLTMLVVLFLTVRPLSVKVYRRLSAQMGMSVFLDAMALLLPNTRLIVTGDSDIPTPVGSSVLVCNHILDGDWWALFMLGRCVGCRGTMKAFLRNEYLQIKMDELDQATREPSSPNSAMHNSNGRSSSSTSLTANGCSPSRISLTVNQNHHSPILAYTAPNSGSQGSSSNSHPLLQNTRKPPSDLSLVAKLLHIFLDFPLLNGEESGSSDREKLFSLLRSLASENAASTAPVHFIFFPEGWSIYNNPNSGSRADAIAADRRAILAKSNEFAKREGKPQLQCLLQPRTRIFNASLECLRESNPFVYDVTLAYSGYNGSLPTSIEPLSISTLFFKILRRNFPKEVHVRIKRYSMEEALQIDNVNWLVKKWAEKDRLLTHFARHQQFPNDSRGFYGIPRVFNTRFHSLETSIGSLFRLILITSAIPVLVFVSVPLTWALLWIWVVTKALQFVIEFISGTDRHQGMGSDSGMGGRHTPGSVPSAFGTPFFPPTPFASPNIVNWSQNLFAGGGNKPK